MRSQRLGGVGDAVERTLEERDAPPLTHLAGKRHERSRAHHHVDARGVGGGDVGIAGVAGDRGADADAEPLEQRLDLPELAGKVELAEHVDVERPDIVRLDRADDVLEQGLAGEPVTEILRADKARRVDRNHREPVFLRGVPADGVDVVADQRGDASGVDEDRRRAKSGGDFADRPVELALSLPHHDVEFGKVGRKARAPQRGAGRRRAAIVPGVALARERPVDEMCDVGDRLQARSWRRRRRSRRPRLPASAAWSNRLCVPPRASPGSWRRRVPRRDAGPCP